MRIYDDWYLVQKEKLTFWESDLLAPLACNMFYYRKSSRKVEIGFGNEREQSLIFAFGEGEHSK